MRTAPRWRASQTKPESSISGTDGKPPILKSDAELIGGTFVQIQLLNSLPNTAGLMVLSGTDSAVPLFGGIVHPYPVNLDFPVVTDQFGRWAYNVLNWPGTIPPGVKLYWQVGLFDPGAVEGISLSNALQSTQP